MNERFALDSSSGYRCSSNHTWSESIEQLANQYGDSMNVDAGTVLSVEKAIEAKKHGAQFFVTPHAGLDVIRFGVKSDIPIMAGAMTPIEIHSAYEAGACFVKVFSIGTLQNTAEYLQAGAVAWGLVGSLIDKAALERGDFDTIV